MQTRSFRDRSRERQWSREESWWRDHFRTRPYVVPDRDFSFYRPAYRYAYESAARYPGRHWDEVEPELRRGWSDWTAGSALAWEDARASVRDAWQHFAETDDGSG